MRGLPELTLGNTVVTFMFARSFVFQDAHDPARVVSIDDVDVIELILFLHGSSKTARERIDLLFRPDALGSDGSEV